jgi:predicted NUDIX family NTP pyrophosphohydrolase
MPRAQSAGVLLYRRRGPAVEVLLVHPGGPFWSRKDEGAWSIPKGEFDDAEVPATAARREFTEETGQHLTGDLTPLTPVRQSRGKIVHPFAIEGDLDPAAIMSNTFTLEWPPRSGRMQSFPEIDRAAWFTLDEAARRIVAGQRAILDELRERLRPSGSALQ